MTNPTIAEITIVVTLLSELVKIQAMIPKAQPMDNMNNCLVVDISSLSASLSDMAALP